MKAIHLKIALIVLISAFQFSGSAQIEEGAKIEFTEEVHDFGTLKYEEEAKVVFEFKNTGNKPLIISQAKGSCSCTVADWTKEPIAPGATGTITATYNTTRVGPINKSVTVSSNAINEPTKVLRIKGEVLPKPETITPVNPVGPVKE